MLAVPVRVLLAITLAGTAMAEESDWTNLARLKAGDRIHVVRSDMHGLDGRLGRWDADGLVLETSGGPLILHKDTVVRISRNHPGHRVRNGLLLGLAGATIGAGALRFGIACNESDHGCRNVKLATLAGAAAGAGLGAALPSTETVYRVRTLPAPGGR